jgi:hypothetical protein
MGTCSRKVPRLRSRAPWTQEARTITYTDDGYIKAKLNVVVQVLTELKCVLKEDVGLDLNVSKTSILPKGTTMCSM